MGTRRDDLREDPAVSAWESTATVHLIGRMGGRVDVRDLPSGDAVVTFTVVIDRPRRAGAPASSPRVDAIPCQAFRAVARRRAVTLAPGTWVEVEGTLRRRFWRSPGGLGSAVEVEVTRLSALRTVVRA